jgi:hypothetical protein
MPCSEPGLEPAPRYPISLIHTPVSSYHSPVLHTTRYSCLHMYTALPIVHPNHSTPRRLDASYINVKQSFDYNRSNFIVAGLHV